MANIFFALLCILFILSSADGQGASQTSQSCVYACLNRFTSMADKMMGGTASGNSAGVPWQNLLHISNDGHRPRTEQEMRKNFDEMCTSFRAMKSCIQQCRDIWLRDSVVSGFASIQYVCEDQYQEFIKHLPCLAANERRVVRRCSKETNQTAAAIASLEKTVHLNDVNQMTAMLAALCRNTSQIIDCLTPATKEMCGKRPASILRKLVTLGFRSIEQMYRRMKIEHKLPEECAKLAHTFPDDDDDVIILKSQTVHFPRIRTHTTAPSTRKDKIGRQDVQSVDDSNIISNAFSHSVATKRTMSREMIASMGVIYFIILLTKFTLYV